MRSRASFTLIELLVVIAILSILAALLVPAMREALDRAKSIACQSNIHQVSVALVSYADDHDGVMPAYWDNPTHDPSGRYIHWQYTVGINYLNDQEATYGVPSAIRKSALHCPADTAITIPYLGGKPTRNIAINGTMCPGLGSFHGLSWPQPCGATMARLSRVKYPSGMCMGGDGGGADFTNEWGSAARYYDINMGNLFWFIRHMGGFNMVMMDGHLIYMTPEEFERIVSEQGYRGIFFDWIGRHQ